MDQTFATDGVEIQHGSWNRHQHSGYKVVFVPFVHGRPQGMPMDVLTGFLNDKDQARGRPVVAWSSIDREICWLPTMSETRSGA